MFHGAIEKMTMACFYGPKYIEDNTVFNSSLASGKTRNINCCI